MQFPTTPAPSYNIDIIARWNTKKSQYDSGKEQRRSKQVQDLYDVKLKFSRVTLANMVILWNFYQSCKGAAEEFYIYDLAENRAALTGLYVGLTDGTTAIFDLPGKNTSSQSIYLDGVLQGGGYTILTGGGTESADRVSFTVAPGAGKIITADFTGDLRIKCRFKDDAMTRSNFAYQLFTTGIELVGLPV